MGVLVRIQMSGLNTGALHFAHLRGQFDRKCGCGRRAIC